MKPGRSSRTRRRKLLDSNPNIEFDLLACVTLPCAYSALEKAEETIEAVTEILRIMPNFSIEAIATRDLWSGWSFYFRPLIFSDISNKVEIIKDRHN